MADFAPSVNIEALVAEHHAGLYRYAFRLTGAQCDAEDLTQQTFLAAQQKLDQLRDPQNSRGWLFTILRNCYRKNARKRTPWVAASLDLDMDSIPQVHNEIGIDEEQLQKAINDLPDEFKLVLLMFYFEQCSYREIAQRLDVPPGTVMSRLARAKRHLRSRLFDSHADMAASISMHDLPAPRRLPKRQPTAYLRG
jgi:RNA polymerase sigma-70 factor (ECF subfamily)